MMREESADHWSLDGALRVRVHRDYGTIQIVDKVEGFVHQIHSDGGTENLGRVAYLVAWKSSGWTNLTWDEGVALVKERLGVRDE